MQYRITYKKSIRGIAQSVPLRNHWQLCGDRYAFIAFFLFELKSFKRVFFSVCVCVCVFCFVFFFCFCFFFSFFFVPHPFYLFLLLLLLIDVFFLFVFARQQYMQFIIGKDPDHSRYCTICRLWLDYGPFDITRKDVFCLVFILGIFFFCSDWTSYLKFLQLGDFYFIFYISNVLFLFAF